MRVDDAFRSFLDGEPIAERRAEAEILRQLEPRFAFDYVCVDEAQDCSDAERDLLRVLYSPERIVLADGMEQLIRRQTPCDWTNGIAAGVRLRIDLAQSLRMSRNVAEFATAVAREMGFAGWRVTPHPQLSGGRVIVQARPYDETLLRELVATLDDIGLPRKDLLICVPPAEIIADGGRRTSRIGALLETLSFRVWNGCDELVRQSDVAELDQIRIVQYDSMRGLEGWCTLLVGLDTFYQHRLSHPNLRPDDRSTPEQVAKRWLLMAMTRAASTLAITLDDAQSEVAQWLRAASGNVPAAVTGQ